MHRILCRMRPRTGRRAAFWAGVVALHLIVILTLAASPARAQGGPRGHDPEEHLAKLQEELDLTDQQVEQIRAIFAEQHSKFEELHAQEDADRESRREAFRQLHEETHERIKAVLTEEQQARLEELHAEYKERHGHEPGYGGHGDHDGHGHGEKERPDNG